MSQEKWIGFVVNEEGGNDLVQYLQTQMDRRRFVVLVAVGEETAPAGAIAHKIVDADAGGFAAMQPTPAAIVTGTVAIAILHLGVRQFLKFDDPVAAAAALTADRCVVQVTD